MRGRHPSPYELAAFFDGEDAPGVFPHAAGCHRCRAALFKMQRVRAAVRGGTVPPLAPTAPAGRRWPVALVPVAAVLALVLGALSLRSSGPSVTRVAGRGDALPVPPSDPAPAAGGQGAADPVAGPSVAGPSPDPGSGTSPGSPSPSHPAAGAAVSPAQPPAPAAPDVVARAAFGTPGPPATVGPAGPAPGPWRLGVPVPSSGPLARQGEEAVRAVRAVAEAANRDGGVGGRPVEVVAVPADGARSAPLPEVDVFVGGFGFAAVRPAEIDWILPADPRPTEPGVAAGEVGAEQAGAFLGARLEERGVAGPVGVVVGPGPDAGLADGLARRLPVERVAAPDVASCGNQVAELRGRGVNALAVAGPPELARHCADAAARIAWRPYGGLVLSPSAAYSHLEREWAAQDAQTAVGFPVPGSPDPGAQRFRRAVPGADSYRALVSFAAAELALAVARETGGISAGRVSAGTWRSDLYHLESGRNAAPRPVNARFGRWTPS